MEWPGVISTRGSSGQIHFPALNPLCLCTNLEKAPTSSSECHSVCVHARVWGWDSPKHVFIIGLQSVGDRGKRENKMRGARDFQWGFAVPGSGNPDVTSGNSEHRRRGCCKPEVLEASVCWRRGSHPYWSVVKAVLGGRDGLNDTQGPRRAQMRSNRPGSDQWVSTRKQAGGQGVPERGIGSKAFRDASRCRQIPPEGELLKSPNGVSFLPLWLIFNRWLILVNKSSVSPFSSLNSLVTHY